MDILSDPKKDMRSRPRQPGGYEWWYFDGISADGRYSFVIIFYEGNPFSTRYNARLTDSKSTPMPDAYPAVSISIYENDRTIFYGFTEFEEKDAVFREDVSRLQIGNHRMKGIEENNILKYEIFLEETLPSGDAIEGQIMFDSPETNTSLFNQPEETPTSHRWNLVQPRADVKANIQLFDNNGRAKEIIFEGRGYHDHNTGQEPMRNEFTDWYWGRFHFEYGTLVYYVMNRQESEQHQAWLISRDNGTILQAFDEIDLVDKGLTLFGLKTARKIGLRSHSAEVQIQQSQLLDNGPFYQRFQGKAFLRILDENIVESVEGISEYIRPDRIHRRLFWPLMDMRIHYKQEGPHWVQRSKMLYRWTW